MGFKTRGTLVTMEEEARQVTERFLVREFVVELAGDNPRYPQFAAFQLTGDRCELLDGLNVGDEIEVEFSLQGRDPSAGRVFNNLNVWEITLLSSAGPPQRDPAQRPNDQPTESPPDDDVPF